MKIEYNASVNRLIQYKQLDDSFFLQVEALQQTYINLIYGTLLEEFHRLLKNGDFIGAFDGERLIGYSGAAYSREFKGYAALMTVVARDYWHKEVGKQLVEAVLKKFLPKSIYILKHGHYIPDIQMLTVC